jgi:hypothetical protein
MKDDKALSPADEADLRYLRNQVDRLSERRYSKDAGPNAHNEYWHAKEDLKKFVSRLRQEGKNI